MPQHFTPESLLSFYDYCGKKKPCENAHSGQQSNNTTETQPQQGRSLNNEKKYESVREENKECALTIEEYSVNNKLHHYFC